MANIALLGSYMASSFVAAGDGHGGTLISTGAQSMNEYTARDAAARLIGRGVFLLFCCTAGVRSWQILLQKPFCTRDQNFFWLYTRLSCKNVGDLIARSKLAGDLGNVSAAANSRVGASRGNSRRSRVGGSPVRALSTSVVVSGAAGRRACLAWISTERNSPHTMSLESTIFGHFVTKPP
jgi:hypothetical protein